MRSPLGSGDRGKPLFLPGVAFAHFRPASFSWAAGTENHLVNTVSEGYQADGPSVGAYPEEKDIGVYRALQRVARALCRSDGLLRP